MKKKRQHERKRPLSGDHFGCLFITDNDNVRLRKEYTQYLHASGVEIRHTWKPGDTPTSLDQRYQRKPPDAEIVLFDRTASINKQQMDRLRFEAKKAQRFVISDAAIKPADIPELLERFGYKAPAIEAPEMEASTIGTELPGAAQVHVEAESEAEPKAVDPRPPTEAHQPCKTWEEAGALLKRCRESIKGLGVGRIAAEIGCSDSYYYGIERGKMIVAGNVCLAIERYFGLPIKTLPRLASRENHRISAKPKLPAATAPTPPPVQIELPEPPAPVVAAEPAPVAAAPEPVSVIESPPVAVTPEPAPVALAQMPTRTDWAGVLARLSPDDVDAFLGALRREFPRLGVNFAVVRRTRTMIDWAADK